MKSFTIHGGLICRAASTREITFFWMKTCIAWWPSPAIRAALHARQILISNRFVAAQNLFRRLACDAILNREIDADPQRRHRMAESPMHKSQACAIRQTVDATVNSFTSSKLSAQRPIGNIRASAAMFSRISRVLAPSAARRAFGDHIAALPMSAAMMRIAFARLDPPNVSCGSSPFRERRNQSTSIGAPISSGLNPHPPHQEWRHRRRWSDQSGSSRPAAVVAVMPRPGLAPQEGIGLRAHQQPEARITLA